MHADCIGFFSLSLFSFCHVWKDRAHARTVKGCCSDGLISRLTVGGLFCIDIQIKVLSHWQPEFWNLLCWTFTCFTVDISIMLPPPTVCQYWETKAGFICQPVLSALQCFYLTSLRIHPSHFSNSWMFFSPSRHSHLSIKCSWPKSSSFVISG